MPRTARIVNPAGGVYHVINRGNNKGVIFRDDHDFLKFLKALATYKARHGFKMYHYILMSNHIHLVIDAPPLPQRLSKIMQGVQQTYSQHYKQKYGFIGHLWQSRFKNIPIETDAHLLAVGIYIELNPVRAGIVADAGQYRWSSYGVYAFGEQQTLVDRNPLYETLGKNDDERRMVYRKLVEMWAATKGVPDKQARGQSPLGSSGDSPLSP